MAWVKIDDQFSVNAKVLAAGKDARELHISALCHCNRNLTDGFVDAAVVRQIGALFEVYDTDAAVARLLAVGLWEPCDGGYTVHDYLEYNPSAQEVTARRAARAEAGRRGGMAKHQAAQGVANAPANAEQTVSKMPGTEQANACPDPDPPVPPQQPAPERRPPDDDPEAAALFQALADAGQMLNATDAQLWAALLAEHPAALLIAGIREARNVGARPSPKYVGTMAARCRAEGVQPGQWAEKGRSRASPKPAQPLPPLTPGYNEATADRGTG